MLVAYLRTTVAGEPATPSFAEAITAHQAAARERRAAEAASIGWDWLADAERGDDAPAEREPELV